MRIVLVQRSFVCNLALLLALSEDLIAKDSKECSEQVSEVAKSKDHENIQKRNVLAASDPRIFLKTQLGIYTPLSRDEELSLFGEMRVLRAELLETIRKSSRLTATIDELKRDILEGRYELLFNPNTSRDEGENRAEDTESALKFLDFLKSNFDSLTSNEVPKERFGTQLIKEIATRVLPSVTQDEPSHSMKETYQKLIDLENQVKHRYLPLVYIIAAKTSSSQNFMDAFQAGSIGLILNLDRYDETNGSRFDAFIQPWIKQFIVRSFARGIFSWSTSGDIFSRQKIIDKITDLLQQKLHRQPTIEEIAYEYRRRKLLKKLEREPTEGEILKHLNSSIRTIEKLKVMNIGVYTGQTQNEAETELSIEELASTPAKGAFTTDAEKMNLLLAGLPPRERYVLAHYFGIGGAEKKTQADLGKEFDLTHQRVSGIIARAIEDLKEVSEAKGLKMSHFLSHEFSQFLTQNPAMNNIPLDDAKQLENRKQRMRHQEDTEQMIRFLSRLSENEQYIISSIYGLNGTPTKTVAQLAAELHIHPSTISSTRSRAVAKINKFARVASQADRGAD